MIENLKASIALATIAVGQITARQLEIQHTLTDISLIIGIMVGLSVFIPKCIGWVRGVVKWIKNGTKDKTGGGREV